MKRLIFLIIGFMIGVSRLTSTEDLVRFLIVIGIITVASLFLYPIFCKLFDKWEEDDG